MAGQSRVEASTQASEQMRMVFLDVELFDQPGVDGFHDSGGAHVRGGATNWGVAASSCVELSSTKADSSIQHFG